MSGVGGNIGYGMWELEFKTYIYIANLNGVWGLPPENTSYFRNSDTAYFWHFYYVTEVATYNI